MMSKYSSAGSAWGIRSVTSIATRSRIAGTSSATWRAKIPSSSRDAWIKS